jgi:IS5 family transposase
MINYNSSAQLTIMEFETPFQTSLDPTNRWVKLSKAVPWDRFAAIYIKAMNTDFGRPGVSPRTVLGAMVIKHILKLDDRGTIETIQENPYMQFFVGLSGFITKRKFE